MEQLSKTWDKIQEMEVLAHPIPAHPSTFHGKQQAQSRASFPKLFLPVRQETVIEIACFPPISTAPFLVMLSFILAVNMAAQNRGHISGPSLHLCHVIKFWPVKRKHRQSVQLLGNVIGKESTDVLLLIFLVPAHFCVSGMAIPGAAILTLM